MQFSKMDSIILNVDLDETQWILATLPVRNGGLGMRFANTLATSTFLASAVSTSPLQQALLATSHTLLTYTDRIRVDTAWNSLSNAPAPEPALLNIQKAWDAPIMSNLLELVFASAASEIDLAALSPHSGD